MNYCRFKEQEREERILLGPPHPADIFREEVWPRLQIDRRTLASQLGVSISTASKFINRRARVSPRIAAGLANVSGRNPLYWLVLQAQHDAWLIHNDAEGSLVSPARPNKSRYRIPELA
jgi:addiction module HigA family antidote